MIKKQRLIGWISLVDPRSFSTFHLEQLAAVNFTTFWTPYLKALYPAVSMDIRLLSFIKN